MEVINSLRITQTAATVAALMGFSMPTSADEPNGMVLDAADHDTWSVGSFFVNPFVAPERVPDGCPNWTVDGQIKLSAEWLIENAGYTRGYSGGRPRVAVSGKHTLALTNRGGATTDELVALAREVRDGVRERFGVELHPEPVLVGVAF